MYWDSPRHAKYKGLLPELTCKKRLWNALFSERYLKVFVMKDTSNYLENAEQDFASDNLWNQYCVFPTTARVQRTFSEAVLVEGEQGCTEPPRLPTGDSVLWQSRGQWPGTATTVGIAGPYRPTHWAQLPGAKTGGKQCLLQEQGNNLVLQPIWKADIVSPSTQPALGAAPQNLRVAQEALIPPCINSKFFLSLWKLVHSTVQK